MIPLMGERLALRFWLHAEQNRASRIVKGGILANRNIKICCVVRRLTGIDPFDFVFEKVKDIGFCDINAYSVGIFVGAVRLFEYL